MTSVRKKPEDTLENILLRGTVCVCVPAQLMDGLLPVLPSDGDAFTRLIYAEYI